MKTFKQLIKLASQPLKSLKETKLDLSKNNEKQTRQHKKQESSVGYCLLKSFIVYLLAIVLFSLSALSITQNYLLSRDNREKYFHAGPSWR